MLPEVTPAFPLIVGTGAVSSLGSSATECFDALVAGRTGVGPLTGFPVQRFRVQHAYQVSDVPRRDREVGLATSLVVRAISRAAAEAELGPMTHVPVIVGTGLGESRTVESAWLDGRRLSDEQGSLVAGVRAATGALDVQVFSNACSASLFALAAGCDLIASGTVPSVVVAGVDVLTQSMVGLLDRVHLSPPESVRPFDADRQGVLMGDGAAAVVLRRHDRHERSGRSGRPRIAVRAVSLGCDAFHVTAPDDRGIEHTIRSAYAAGCLAPAEVDAVFAHGTGTVLNDQAEASALARTVPAGVPVTSIKGATGHTSGGSGLFSVCMAVETLKREVLPGTHGLERPDVAARGLSLSARARPVHRPRVVQVDAFGFGGVNAVTLVEKDPDEERLISAWSVPRAPRRGNVTGAVRARLHGPHGSLSVRGLGICFPDDGVHGLRDLAQVGEGQPAADDPGAFDLRAAIGRKGFRTMTPATRVAVVAMTDAVAGVWDANPRDDEAFFTSGERRGIVVASEHGNTATVCQVAETIDREGVRRASPLELPNASRNVLAATGAIRLGVTGACLTMDSGAAGGWDALRWAAQLVRSGRCDEVLCVAAEAPSPEVEALTGTRLAHGAIAVLVSRAEPPTSAEQPPAEDPNEAAGAATASSRVGGALATLSPLLALAETLTDPAQGPRRLGHGWWVSQP